MGRLTADPDLRQTQSGVATCRFTVAADRKFADKTTGEKQADFITCVAWRQTAEFVSRYFTKGKMIAVEGELRNNNYQDRNHPDVTHYTTEVLVDQVHFCGDKGNPTTERSQGSYTAAQPAQDLSYGDLSSFEEILSDEAPF